MESSTTHKVRIGHLDTKAGIREELTRIYRGMRRGQIGCADGARLCFVLVTLSKLLEPDGFLDLSFLQGDRMHSINKEGKAHERV